MAYNIELTAQELNIVKDALQYYAAEVDLGEDDSVLQKLIRFFKRTLNS